MACASVSTILFDLDGTLIDSVELILNSYRHTLRVHRGTIPPDAVWLEGLGTPLKVQFRKFTDDPAEIDAMVATYRAYNLANHDNAVREFPGVREAVEELSRRRVRLGVVTSKMREGAYRGLRKCGYDGLFEVVVGADDVERPKPDPEPVRHALRLLDVAAAQAVFVGDSPHDLVAGRAAGVQTAAVLWGPFPRSALEPQAPDHWIAKPGHLTGLASP
jgi:pyrophosphatase PpaX